MGSEKLAEASRKFEAAPKGKVARKPLGWVIFQGSEQPVTFHLPPVLQTPHSRAFQTGFRTRQELSSSTFLRELRGHLGGLPGGSGVKNPPVMLEIWVRSLGGEDPLEQQMATHTSILAWKSHRQKSLSGYSPYVSQKRQT